MRLETAGLSIELAGRRVLRGVDLSVEGGEVVGLLGPNGAGKSTLLRALAGLIAGDASVLADGEDIAALTPRARARRIAYLPQNRVIAWPMKVADVVMLGRTPWTPFGRKRSANDVQSCRKGMTLADVAHLADRRATELSGGEQARVAAARVIAQDTPILLADEPVSGLDPAHQIGMMGVFRKLAEEGRAVAVSLHDLTLAARWCDRLVLLRDGTVAAAGAPAEVLTAETLRDAFGVAARIDHDPGGLIVTPVAIAGAAP